MYAAADGVHVLVNKLDPTGKPQFTDSLVYAAPTAGGSWSISNLVAVDFSGDSRPDVILADEKGRSVVFLENSCSPAPQG